MQKFKRIAAFLTAVTMTFSLFPTTAFASNKQSLEVSGLTEDYVYSEGLSHQYLTKAEGLVAINDFEYGYEASEASEHYNNYSIKEASADDTFIVDDITYQIILNHDNIPTNNVQILKCQNKNGDVIIPSTVENNGTTYTVISVGAKSFLNCDGITSVTLPNSVKSIEEFAFSSCSKLKNISLPDGLERMGQQIFFNCLALEEIDIPDSVTTMGEGMFINCTNLKNVKLPNNDKLGVIPNLTFHNCKSLTNIGSTGSGASVEIPKNIKSIGADAFLTSGLKGKITIPNGITTIGEEAFAKCAVVENSAENILVKSGITEVVIPDSVTTIGAKAFIGCAALRSAEIPNSVTTMGIGVFAECLLLDNVTLSSNLTTIPANTFQYCLNLTSVGSNMSGTGAVKIPNIVTSIGDYAFIQSGLTSAEIPNTITTMGKGVFKACPNLSSVKFSNKLSSIPDEMFAYCIGLPSIGSAGSGKSIEFPETITDIGVAAFAYSGLAGKVDILQGVKNIGKSAFEGCTKMTGVNITSSVTTISDTAFYGCSSLKKAWVPNNVTTMGIGVFAKCSSLNDVRLSASLIELPANTFQDCDSIKSVGYYNVDNSSEYIAADVQLPNTMKIIGEGAFMFCNRQPQNQKGQPEAEEYSNEEDYGLKTVDLPESIAVIEDSAFFDCKYLTQISLSDGLTSIEPYAFAMSGLTSIDLPNSVMYIKKGAFESCESLESVDMPTGKIQIDDELWMEERSLEDGVFSGCYALKEIDLSDTYIKEIPNNTFSGCTNLKEIIIPDTVTKIGESAFNNCYGLPGIELPHTLESIGSGAFNNCKELTQIIIPAKVNHIGYIAFSGCINLKDVTVGNLIPPTLGDDAFKNCSSELKINIPVGTKADYNETPWSNYTLKCNCYISGAITDESGNSISNVKVTIFDEDENEIVTEYTDSNGQYTTYDMALEDGNYILKFSKDGYIERTETITANGTNIFDADFVLNGYKVYTVTEGTDGAYEKGSAKGLKFVCDVDYTKFKEIMVDGAVVDNSNYKAESGSTVITLKSSYLDALNAGAHTLRVNFEDGYAETNFTVNSTETNNPSQNGNTATGNSSNNGTNTATGNSSNNGTNTGNGSNSNISNSNKTPKTGDQSFIMLSCALVGAAALSMGVLKRKRNSR